MAARTDRAADRDQGDPASRRRARGGGPRHRRASSSPTMAAVRSTARSPRSTRCRRSPRRSATSWRSSSTAACAAAATSIKALALGADAVCLGRPYIWGLALEGQAGVETVLKMVLAELDLTMALCGFTGPDQLGAGLPRRRDSSEVARRRPELRERARQRCRRRPRRSAAGPAASEPPKGPSWRTTPVRPVVFEIRACRPAA